MPVPIGINPTALIAPFREVGGRAALPEPAVSRPVQGVSGGESEGAAGGARISGAASTELSVAQQRQVAELRQIDQRVRAHELAHIASGAGVVRGGASYQYAVGPDGLRYAVGGEVPIDASPGRTPEQTVLKARAIQRAALAPADPSTTDRQVAAQAAAMEAEASAEIRRAAREAQSAGVSDTQSDSASQTGPALALYRQVGAENAATSALLAVA